MEGFLLNLDTAMEFYNRCAKRKAETKEARLKILEELKTELRAIKLNDTDLERQLRGKKVLRIKKEPK